MTSRRERVNVGRVVTARKSTNDSKTVAARSRRQFRRMPARAKAEPAPPKPAPKQTTSSVQPWVKMHRIPEKPNYNRLFVASPIEKIRTRDDLRAKQRAKRLPSNVLGAVDVNDDGIVDGVELKLSTFLRKLPGDNHGLSARSANKFRVKEGKKLMVKNFLDETGFEKVRFFAPQLCADTLESTIEKMSSSACFKDDYRYLMVKAARDQAINGSAVKELTRPFANAQRSVFQATRDQEQERKKSLFSSAAKNVCTRVDKGHLFRQKYEGVGSFKQQTVEILKNSFFRSSVSKSHKR